MLNNEICEITNSVSKQLSSFNHTTGEKTITIEPNSSKTVFEIFETGVITRLWLTFPGWFWRHWDTEAANSQEVLRTTILKLYFDGNEKASVSVPVGDFFGIGHMEYKHFMSKYIGMSSGGFYSYFAMPFKEGFKAEIVNMHSSIRIDLFININFNVMEIPDSWGRFHGAFNCGEIEGHEALEVINVNGKGHFAGCSLSIQGKPLQYLSYLEAPEYIYIDNNDELTIYGTGMEDYFNGGWYFRSGEFDGQMHGAPIKDTLRSLTSMYRFHDNDRICFNEKLRMIFLNPWDRQRLKPFIFSSVAYYYLSKSEEACYNIPSIEEITKLYRVRDIDFHSVP